MTPLWEVSIHSEIIIKKGTNATSVDCFRIEKIINPGKYAPGLIIQWHRTASCALIYAAHCTSVSVALFVRHRYSFEGISFEMNGTDSSLFSNEKEATEPVPLASLSCIALARQTSTSVALFSYGTLTVFLIRNSRLKRQLV